VLSETHSNGLGNVMLATGALSACGNHVTNSLLRWPAYVSRNSVQLLTSASSGQTEKCDFHPGMAPLITVDGGIPCIHSVDEIEGAVRGLRWGNDRSCHSLLHRYKRVMNRTSLNSAALDVH
jgi:hypothetical protein